jgi:chemotaxis protein methyltransferase CheR
MAVLDRECRVTAANGAYIRLFPGNLPSASDLVQLCQPDWNRVVLRTLRDVIELGHSADNIEVTLEVPGLGLRHLLLSARGIFDCENPDDAVALALLDVTGSRLAQRAAADLEKQHAVLLQEANHRIANNLQIIGSMLLLKARSVKSEETRTHLRDIHERLVLVAEVQHQLCFSGRYDEIDIEPFVAQLCGRLSRSMTEGDDRVAIHSSCSGGKIKSDHAMSFGQIVTELVLNALKHGFPDGRRGAIAVKFDANGPEWRLSVSDDGIGRCSDARKEQIGLGMNIVEALARSLDARVEISEIWPGSSTAIIHSLPAAKPSAGRHE